MFTIACLLIPLILSVAGLHWYYRYREQKVAEVAASLGLEFSPSDQVFEQLDGLYLTRVGTNGSVENCMTRDGDAALLRVFEYRFYMGKNAEAMASHTVVLLSSDDLDAPRLLVRPKHGLSMLDPYASVATGPVLIHQEFDKRWIVTGEDSESVRGLFDEELIQFVQTNKWWMEAEGHRLVLYRWNHTVNHTLLEDFLRQGLEAFALLKSRCPSRPTDRDAIPPETQQDHNLPVGAP